MHPHIEISQIAQFQVSKVMGFESASRVPLPSIADNPEYQNFGPKSRGFWRPFYGAGPYNSQRNWSSEYIVRLGRGARGSPGVNALIPGPAGRSWIR